MAVLRLLFLASASSLLVASIGTAQDASPNEAPAKPAAQQTDLTAEQQLDQVIERYQSESSRLRVKLRSADTRAEATKELATLTEESVAKVRAIAEENRTALVGLKALETLLYPLRAPAETQEWVKNCVLEDHANNKALVPVVVILGRDSEFLESLLKATESQDVRGVVLYNQMQAAKGRELTEGNAAEVLPLMERIAKEFSDVELMYPGGRVRGSLGSLVGNELFAFKNLRIGKVAPDIEGEDVNGESFKLSEYRGKVVVIDFWGDW